MIILGCDWSTVRHVSVRIFSTLILLALDRFGEPIRMKHSRCKQHTGEGEEKDIDCSDQYSEVLRTHTHTAFVFMKPLFGFTGILTLQVQSEAPHAELSP